MSLRAFVITSFLLISSIGSTYAFPDQVLHQSYAVQFFAVDSICVATGKHDSATAARDMHALQKWAEDNKDDQLRYFFLIGEFDLMARRGPTSAEKIKIENTLPQLIKELDEKKMPELEAQALEVLAYYYWLDPHKYAPAFEASQDSYDIYSRFSSEQFPPKYSFLVNHGTCYYRFKDYHNALRFYLAALNTETRYHHPLLADLHNDIGLCYRLSGVYDSAEYYFVKGYAIADHPGDLIWKSIIAGNLGITYYLEKRYREAIPLLDTDIAVGLRHNRLNINAAKSIAILGDTYLELGEKKKGLEALQQAYSMVVEGNKWKNYDLLQSIYSLLAKAYALNGNYQMAYNFADSNTRVSDSSAAERNALILSGVQQKINNEKHVADLRKRDRETRIAWTIWAFLLITITSLTAAIFFVLRNYRNQKKTNELLSKEKKRSEDLLLNILPSEVADELKDKGTAEARYFDHVTVLFTDFVNFTQASEKMSPQQLIDELHACFKAFDEIIGKYHIEKIKTIGDAYLAVCGLPVADPKHAEQVVRAALEINDFMRQRSEKLGDRTFTIRIGIHSGSVVAGIVGVIKFAYDIWGDAVNIAARMEQNSEAGKINISDDTYQLIKSKFRCTHRGQVSAKNKGELNMYFVDGLN